METNKNWKIELCEEKLEILGSSLLFAGKKPSHSFLRLKNDQDEVVGELHGGALDQATGDFGEMKFKLSTVFDQLAENAMAHVEENLMDIFKPMAKNKIRKAVDKIRKRSQSEESKLRVSSRFGDFIESRNVDAVMELKSLPEKEIMVLWDQALGFAEEINHADIEYRPVSLAAIAQNCHSVSILLAQVISGKKITPESRTDRTFAMPGADNDIKEKIYGNKNRTLQKDTPNLLVTSIEHSILMKHDKVNSSIRRSSIRNQP